ncbi:MAG: hypothetical protein V7L22_17095 [Nostoc sp.]|uniref:hypothetical protein n=1 Tax=Nostoc sp. TaxID=1180 RepID=UPI002FF5DD72
MIKKKNIFYLEANLERFSAALLLDVDPVKLVRGCGARLEQYVSDRSWKQLFL